MLYTATRRDPIGGTIRRLYPLDKQDRALIRQKYPRERAD